VYFIVGKEGKPTLSFLTIVDHDKRVLHVSQAFFGATNDKTIFQNDAVCAQLKQGKYADTKYALYDKNGEVILVQGAYLIVDGGFYQIGCLMDTGVTKWTMNSVRFSEFVESIRKDVECLYGILKCRFRYLLNPIETHNPLFIEAAFKAACILNNMILEYDKVYHSVLQMWREDAIDWSDMINLNPDMTDEDIENLSFERYTVFEEEQASNIPFLTLQQCRNTTAPLEIFPSSEYDYKRLKDMLSTSFTKQFSFGQVYWPKRFEGWQRECLALERISIMKITQEVFHTLYGKQSTLVDRNNQTIGMGLFSSISFTKGDVVAVFHGNEITKTAALDLIRNGLGRFLIQLTEEKYVDCRINRFNGSCRASLANSPTHAVDAITQRQAVANCKLKVAHHGNDTHTAKLEAISDIPANTEILWKYGVAHTLNGTNSLDVSTVSDFWRNVSISY
jgi:hypothetical protein